MKKTSLRSRAAFYPKNINRKKELMTIWLNDVNRKWEEREKQGAKKLFEKPCVCWYLENPKNELMTMSLYK